MRSLPVFRVVAIAATVLGGAFVCLFSCGAYVWQMPLVVLVVAAVTFFAVIMRVRGRGFALWRSIGFVALVAVSFVFSEAVAASFYPSAPTSLSQFWHSFIRTLQYGPC
jgi:hypothetical protein